MINIQLTEVGCAVIIDERIIRLLLTARRTRHFFTCLHRYNAVQVTRTQLSAAYHSLHFLEELFKV